MPHINRIRVNNVRYNFGTQFYDDFMMRFDGRNALYDLANGGGKSVLLLLMMQNMIPNCSLDDKQPLEKLFRGPEGSTVIHSLIEWQLDDHLVQDGFRYMLTGFCARKAKADEEEEDKTNAAIEYFNYVIFYRGSNENDIAGLPLSKNGERVTFPGLKNYLKGLARSTFVVKTHVFERKGEYQQFISRYGLYESEWEIIRGINRTEGHVRAYFENNYKTTRKVVEDLLIEEIIQKAFMMQTADANEAGADAGSASTMAENLYMIRDELSRLMQKKQTLDQYDRQKEALEIIRDRTQQMDAYYRAAADFSAGFSRIHRTAGVLSRKRTLSLSIAQKEQEAAADKIEDLTRKLETVRLQTENDRLEAMRGKIRDMEEGCMQIRQQVQRLGDELRLRESMNDHLDCLEAEKQRMAVLETLRFSEKDREDMLAETARYAREWERRCQTRAGELDAKISETESEIAKTREEIAQLENTEREADRSLAVAGHRIAQQEASRKQAQQQFETLKADAGILLIEQVHAKIREQAEQLAAAEKEKGMLEAADAELAQRLDAIAEETRELGMKLTIWEREAAEHETFLEACEKDNARMEKLCEVYQADDPESLKEKITARYHRLTGENIRVLESRTRLLRQITALDEGLLSVADDQVRQLMNDLRSRCGSICVYGADYLRELEPDAAQACLERLPFLSGAVIVKGGLDRSDEVLDDPEAAMSGRRIPVIALEAVSSGQRVLDKTVLKFTGGTGNGSDAVQLRQHLQEVQELQTARLTRINDEMRTYAQDLEDVAVYLRTYGQDRAYHEETLAGIRADIENAGERRNALAEEASRIRKECGAHEKRCGELESALLSGRERQVLYQELKDESLNLDTLGEELSGAEAERDSLLKTRMETTNKLTARRAGLEKLTEALRNQRQNRQALTDDFEANWRVYAQQAAETEGGGVEEVLDDAHLLAALEGAKKACEQAGGDLTDKQLLMENYASNAGRLRKAIESRGIDIAQLEELRAQDMLIRTEESALQDLRDGLAAKEEAYAVAKAELEKNQARMYELSGSVSQAMRAAQKRFGELKAVDLKHQDPQVYIHQTEAFLAQTREAYTQAEGKVARLSKETWQLESMVRDFSRMMQAYRITPDDETDICDLNENLKEKFDALPEQAEKLRRMQAKCRDDFERDRVRTISALEGLGAFGLAQSIKEQVTFPGDAAAADALVFNINETIHLIALEKAHAASGVDQLLEIKKHFEDQCLQVCMNIRTELDKLPKMSVITMDNERIQMLGLRIPYISENLYAQRMSDYIEDIVHTADQLGSREEQMALIRRQLSWKRLFSVIVTDMNAIRLTLYKRERVREQSRYLKYEEAVGSTGQSQGIYIQFLIAVIHYISSIHAGAVKGVLKKTIFIDNPFGAAKDIYIWEPIFQLLRTNHVQLIVPARGTSPAITGKFDVNYVLDQKMMDNKLQTIVAEFSSNVVTSDLDYEKIDYEQMSLFDLKGDV